MTGRGRAFALLLVLPLVGGLLAACGGGSSKAISGSWSAPAGDTATQLATQLRTDFPQQCNNFRPFPRIAYVQTYSKIHTPIPLAVGQCTVATENVEISVFADAKHRDDFVTSRQKQLCARAASADAQLSGLRWVVADNWSMQPDSQDLGERLASTLHARYEMTPCSAGQFDWTDTDVAHVESLGSLSAFLHRSAASGLKAG